MKAGKNRPDPGFGLRIVGLCSFAGPDKRLVQVRLHSKASEVHIGQDLLRRMVARFGGLSDQRKGCARIPGPPQPSRFINPSFNFAAGTPRAMAFW